MALRNLIIQNFRWKLISLLLATLVWLVIRFTIASGRNQTLPRQPVMALKAPDDQRVFRIDPPAVDVIVQAIRDVRKDDIHVFVDLTTMPDVSSTFKTVLVRAPEGTKVIRVEPSSVVSVERVTSLDLSLTNSFEQP
jgi:hypothetical protein